MLLAIQTQNCPKLALHLFGHFYFMETLSCKKCGLVDDYRVVEREIHHTAYCNGCDSFIKNIPQGKPFIFMFGKFKGVPLAEMESLDQINYLHWILSSDMNNTIKTKVISHLKEIDGRDIPA